MKHSKKIIGILTLLALLLNVLISCGIPYSDEDCDTAPSDDTEKAEEIDYAELINTVTESAMLFCVTVTSEHSIMGGFGSREVLVGSGVIYRESYTHYYALTNEHVVTGSENALRSKYSVKDAFGNEYAAELLAKDASSDLATVRFAKSAENPLAVASIAESDAVAGDRVISLGTPSGQVNSITMGDVLGIREVEPSENQAKIPFPVTVHSCPLKHGSSGGALLNYELELVGLNYALANTETEEGKYGLAIPVNKILEFLEKTDEVFNGTENIEK